MSAEWEPSEPSHPRAAANRLAAGLSKGESGGIAVLVMFLVLLAWMSYKTVSQASLADAASRDGTR